MQEFTHTIADPVGIHARPAGELVKAAQGFASSVTVIKGTKKADMKRLFSLMALAAKCQDVITIQVEGPDEAVAAQELARLLRENF